jgi:hypothetical protein
LKTPNLITLKSKFYYTFQSFYKWPEKGQIVAVPRQGQLKASLIFKNYHLILERIVYHIALREIGRIERSLYMLKWI